MSSRITTYEDAFGKVLEMEFTEGLRGFCKGLEAEGHTERSIAFTIWKTQEKLRMYKYDTRFLAVLKNEVNKYSWKKGDPRWDEYWAKKREQEKARTYKKELDAYRDNVQDRKDAAKKAFRGKAKGYVYFIQGLCGGAIKIGYSTNPASRLKTLQTGYPDTLRILVLVPGNERTERFFHYKFEEFKMNGEWYKPDERLLKHIEELKAKYPR